MRTDSSPRLGIEHAPQFVENLPREDADLILRLALVCDDPELLRRHGPELRRREIPDPDDDPIDRLYEPSLAERAVVFFSAAAASGSSGSVGSSSSSSPSRFFPASSFRSCFSVMYCRA